MSTPTSEAPTEAFPPAEHAARPFIPRMIRVLAVPIILVWIGDHRRPECGCAAAGNGRADARGVDEPGRRAVDDRDETRRRGVRGVQLRQLGDDRAGGRAAARRRRPSLLRPDDREARGRQQARPARSGLLERPADRLGRAEQRRQGRLRPGVPRRQPGRGAGQRVGRGRPEASSTACSRRRA